MDSTRIKLLHQGKKFPMRIIASIEFGGVTYQAIWASMRWIEGLVAGSEAMALVVRNGDGHNEMIVRRNAKLADVETSLDRLRGLGLKGAQLGHLFNYKGSTDGLAPHVKMLVSSLR
jgi:hypothetical protein